MQLIRQKLDKIVTQLVVNDVSAITELPDMSVDIGKTPTTTSMERKQDAYQLLALSMLAANGYNQTEVETFHETARQAELFNRYAIRDVAIEYFGFSAPSAATIQGLIKYGPILEVGCGLGYWSYLLRKAGVTVVATDVNLPSESSYPWGTLWRGNLHPTPWISDIIPCYAQDAVVAYPDNTLLMSWPCYNATWAYEALRAYKGSTVIYVGEGPSGCTADEKFHGHLQKKFKLLEVVPMLKWHGSHDRCFVYQRKE